MVKNINDARYRQNERLIQDGLAKHFRSARDEVIFNVGQFCKKIGILERTFRNHGGLNGQFRKISRNVARKMRDIAGENMAGHQDARQLYFSVMCYMNANRRYFTISQRRHSALLWEIIFRELHPALEQIWRSSYGKKIDEISYTIYRGEIAAIFSFWVESGFSDDLFSVTLKRTERLTVGALPRIFKLI